MSIFKFSLTAALMFSLPLYAQTNSPASVSTVSTANPSISTAPIVVATPPAISPVDGDTKFSALDVQYNSNFNGKEHQTLRLVTQNRTAGMTAAKVGLFALSVVGAFSGVYVPVDGSGFKKEQLYGGVIDDAKDVNQLKNPSEAVKNQVVEDFKQIAIKEPAVNDKTLPHPVVIHPDSPGWKLIYDKLSGDAAQTNQYHLMFGLSMEKLVRPAGFFKSVIRDTASCSYNSGSKPLDEWKANDYQMVADEHDKIVQACLTQLRPAYRRLIGYSLDGSEPKNTTVTQLDATVSVSPQTRP